MAGSETYVPRRPHRSAYAPLRDLRHHLLHWDAPAPNPARPLLVCLHGWMDVGASFQFMVDALPDDVSVVSLDWRGFGRTERGQADSYWFPDYLGDLDALLHHLSPQGPVDLLGHSMGGNAVMSYAGVRPERVRRLINLEGFGLPAAPATEAPGRLRQWLDELRDPPQLRPYASREDVAARLRKTNPRLAPAHAHWLAAHWAEPAADGRWQLQADPAHKRVNPVLYRVDEVMACWAQITAPTLWIEGAETDVFNWWGDRFSRDVIEDRLATVPHMQRLVMPGAGHMIHHDRPQELARTVHDFLTAP